MKFETKAVHAGVEPDAATGAIMTPIYQVSTYVQDAPGVHKGYEYARTQNPTRDALQNAIAELENGSFGVCFGSGMAAIDGIIKMLEPGDEVISTSDLYGGTFRIFDKVFKRYGLKFHYDPLQDLSVLESLVNKNTKMIWLETPTNPMMNVIDIEDVCRKVQGKGIIVVVDNTFASPALQTPLDLGADLVVHSATKYLGGHSDVVHGCVVGKKDKHKELLHFYQNSCGAVPGPFDCFLILRGLKTLGIRMKQHCENGRAIAEYLKNHPKVDKVHWPGFREHPKHTVAMMQMKDFGGMLSFSLKDDTLEAATKVMSATKLFALAESLGGVESLVGHPASMTHASIPKEEREKTGVVDSLIRLSVGIENAEDLIADLEQAIG